MQNVSRKGYSQNFAKVASQISGVLLCAWKSGQEGSTPMLSTVIYMLIHVLDECDLGKILRRGRPSFAYQKKRRAICPYATLTSCYSK